jgi:hypothetical protein
LHYNVGATVRTILAAFDVVMSIIYISNSRCAFEMKLRFSMRTKVRAFEFTFLAMYQPISFFVGQYAD